jgi:hypothetical protein
MNEEPTTFNEVQDKLEKLAKSLAMPKLPFPGHDIDMTCKCTSLRDVKENWGRIFCCVCDRIIGNLIGYGEVHE